MSATSTFVDKFSVVTTAVRKTVTIDQSKIIIPGTSIINALQGVPFDKNDGSKTLASRNRSRHKTSNDVAVHLDDKFSKIDYVLGMKTTLYPHQQTAVKAMLDLEDARRIPISMSGVTNVPCRLTYNAAVLSEPVGSGKTIDILAVICLSKVPRAIPDIMEFQSFSNNVSIGYVRCKFKKFIKASIIFVGSSVMKQWELAIATFTSLKSYSVNSVTELKVLFNMISNKTVNDYDIILVKNGKITVPIELPDGIVLEDKNKLGCPYIYNLIANLREHCWARVVVDDFDTIRLPHNAGIVRGIFTWYISSTRKKMDYRSACSKTPLTASEMLSHHDYGCASIMYNNTLFKYLNVRNNIDYLQSTTKIPNPKFHVVVFKNPNNKYISMLNSMGDDTINRITEMLNGDAIGTAAEAAGIKTTSVASIFEKILGAKYKQYRFAGDLLSFINEEIDPNEPNRKPMSENPDPSDERYTKTRLLAFEPVEYKYPGVNNIIKETKTEYKEVKDVTGLAIQRVKDNIKQGECPVCKIDMADTEEFIIVKCCNAVFCGECGFKAQNLADRYNRLKGRCSNCRTELTIKDLIFVGHDVDIDNIAEEKFEDEDEVEITPVVKKKVAKTKYSAIISIINNEELDEDKRVDMYIPNMMKGADYLPESKIRKVLIFANFDETLVEVVKELESNNIKYWRLQGGIGEINEAAMAFTKCEQTCAMVVNSTRHCSGLNLQTATDLIFTHRMIDQSVESQVAGRGHRLGRRSPLNIWYMAYDNEYTELCLTHGIRELTKDELMHEKKMESGQEKTILSTVIDNTNLCFINETRSKSAERKAAEAGGLTKERQPTADDETAPDSDDEKVSAKKGKSAKKAKSDADDDSASVEDESTPTDDDE